MRERLRLAVPNKGRLVEPTLHLLHDAGLVFEEHDRSLVARVSNFALDILFVRTNDVIEFVGDGVADLGRDRDRPAGRDRAPSCPGSAPSATAAAGWPPRCPTDSAVQTIDDLAGLRVATAHPNTTRRFFAEQRIEVEVIPISGAVEVAPRLGLAEAIVDLVSTGLDPGDERPAPGRRRPRLGGDPGRQPGRPAERGPSSFAAIDTMLSSVIAARGQKYLMMNAPRPELTELTRPPAGPRARPRSSRSPTTA